MLHCFVVCPFGKENGSAEEKRLFDQLAGLHTHIFREVEKACELKHLSVKIADTRKMPHGRTEIKRAVQQCLDEAAAVIVLLSADKPNVYLELGWAHGLWHAPILLVSNDYNVPVDINNDLHEQFTSAHIDGSDRPGAKALAERLADKIIDCVKRGRQVKQFAHWPDTTLARGAIHIYNRFSDAITPSEWSMMLGAARREIIIGSTSMSRIRGQAFFTTNTRGDQVDTSLENLLLARALDGVNVTILLYHEDNLSIGHLKKRRIGLGEIHDELKRSFAVWSQQRLTFENLARQDSSIGGSYRVIQIRRRHLPFRVTLTEDRVLATLRFYTEIVNSGLCIDAFCATENRDQKNTPVYIQIRNELEYIIEDNSEASEQSYQEWRERSSRAS